MSKLNLCALCGWQVVSDVVSCPSCHAPVLGHAPRRMIRVPVLSRAALLVAGVTASVAVGGCAEDGGPETAIEEEREEDAVGIRPRLTWQLQLAQPPYRLSTGDDP